MKIAGVVLVFILAFQVGGAAEPAQTTKSDAVRAKPYTDAKVVVTLKKGQQVDIQKRQGSWYFVKAGSKLGWMPMLSIHRTKSAATATAGSLSSTATGRLATGGIVSTTGIRGLNEENLQKAVFSDSAVSAAEKHRVAVPDAAEFARASGLKARSVTPLPAPKAKAKAGRS